MKQTEKVVPEMSLFTLRCYLKQRYNITSLKDYINPDTTSTTTLPVAYKLETWEFCLVIMLDASSESMFAGPNNDKFHFYWETMMLSLFCELKDDENSKKANKKLTMSLKEFYNCECNGSNTNSWKTMVFLINLKSRWKYQNR